MNNLQTFGKKYLIPLACCQFTTGARRALLCDLQRNRFLPVPLSLKELIMEYKGKSIASMYADYPEEEHNTLDEYLDFLLEGEYIFLSDSVEDLDRFVDLPLDFFPQGKIQNAIIDLDEHSSFDLKKVIAELISLDCISIQIRSYRPLGLTEILNITSELEESACKNIEFIVPYSEDITCNQEMEDILIHHQRIGGIICYGAPENKSESYLAGQIRVDCTVQQISDEKHCGVFSLFYFSPNIPHFTEAQKYNTCLNQKISIDKSGKIRNCPAMSAEYGNVRDTLLRSVLDQPAFRKLWTIHKDEIQTCRDCEFRYICTDCRAYLEDPDDEYSKPLKCGYDPYHAVWAPWADHPLKQKAISHYGLQELIKR